MAAPRLTDSQKEELVQRYRRGESAQALAAGYGCSPNTVSRVLKAAMDPEELAALRKQSRTRTPVVESEAEAEVDPLEAVLTAPVGEESQAEDPVAPEAADASELAIDDADDFADEGLDDSEVSVEEDGEAAEASEEPVVSHAGEPVEAQRLLPGLLPSSVYMLVAKAVELQPRPLREFPELGLLPEEELERQGLMLFTNPRQAKRQCGRTQRVIKVPDAGVLERRSSYLVAQGITRLVVEGGALFAIPGG